MVELLTRKAQPPDLQSAHEINRRVRQIERDLAILGAMPFPKAEQNGAAGVQVKELAPTTLDSHSSNGGPKELTPGRSKTAPRGLWHVLLNGLCRMGIHRGEWRFLSEGICSQSRECGGCGAIQDRTKHRLQWGYVRNRSCGQQRACMRCHTTDKQRVRHEAWSESWEVEQRWWQGSKEAHRCLRCGVVEEWTDSD